MSRWAELKAQFRFAPLRSQVFVVTLLLGGIAITLLSFSFLWNEKETWRIPCAIGLLMIGAAFVAWLLSHRDVDRRDTVPTTFASTRFGVTVSMDARSLDSDTSRRLFARLVNIATHRRPLPTPDGIVSSDMQPIPNSQAEAVHRAQAATAEGETRLQEFVEVMRDRGEAKTLTQEPNPDPGSSLS